MKRHVTLSIQNEQGQPLTSVGLELAVYPAVGPLGGFYAQFKDSQGWGEDEAEAVCDLLHVLACEGWV